MTVHEIITMVGLLLPIGYLIGRLDVLSDNRDKPIEPFIALLFFLSILSTTIALTLRCVN